MKVKLLEIRDRATFIPMLCVEMHPGRGSSAADHEQWERRRYLLRRCGYDLTNESPMIAMTPLRADGSVCSADPYFWADCRTRHNAHLYIAQHWKELKDGDVVDVEFILGETKAPKVSERETAPL